MNPIAFSIFNVDIYWYGIAYFFAFLSGDFLIRRIVQKNYMPISKDDLDALFFWIFLGILIGGRLGYFFFYDFESLTYIEFFNIRNGGMSFHGGFLGVVFSVLFYSFYYKQNHLMIADLIVSVAPIGLFLGRIANYLNDEISGTIFFNWDYVVLYEAFFEGIVLFSLLNFIFKNFENKGKKFYLFLFFYSFFRVILDFFKERFVIILFLDMGQILSILMMFVGLYFLKKYKYL